MSFLGWLARIPVWGWIAGAGAIGAGVAITRPVGAAPKPGPGGSKPGTPPPPTPTIKLGATDATSQGAVSRWQTILGLKPSGTFDQATDQATRAYQKAHGLVVDGIVGLKTWGSALGKPVGAPPTGGGGSNTMGKPPGELLGNAADSGRSWAQALPANATDEREQAILAAVDAGLFVMPAYIPVTYQKDGHSVTIFAWSDCLAIGLSDPIRVNVNHATAQRIADRLGAMLPTTRMSDAAWQAATKISPQTTTPDAKMATTERMVIHSDKVEAAKSKAGATFCRPVGKDWVNTERLIEPDGTMAKPKHSSIGGGGGAEPAAANFGWQSNSGTLKSPGGVSCFQSVGLAHDIHHTDYSQVLTLYSQDCTIDGVPYKVPAVLADPDRAYLLSDEVTRGTACKVWRYPPVANPGGDYHNA